MRTLTLERLREVLDYDPETGVFRWRARVARCVHVGDVAGCVPTVGRASGWRRIQVDGRGYRAHHLAWLYTYGVWPTADLDHRNGVRDDNRISNLREDLEGQNAQNRHQLNRRNTSGFQGVSFRKGRWRAKIFTNGQYHELGRFDSADEASAAYLTAKRDLHPFWESA